jgi:hypothetical protein
MTWVKTGETSFTTQSSVSINNCFSAEYTHYMILRNFSGSVADEAVRVRLRAGGSDASSANYRAQVIFANSTTVSAVRSLPADGLSSFSNGLGYTETSAFAFAVLRISNPFQEERTTAWSDISYDADGNIRIYRQVNSHDLTNSYDGITVFPASGTITGTITVYGLKES